MNTYILFDLDGTLTDPYEGISKCISYALKGMNFPLHQDYKKFIGPPLTYSFVNFCGMSDKEAVEAVKIYRERFSTVGLFENKVYEGIPNLLAFLKDSGAKLAVATSKPTCFSQRILDKFDLNKYFDVLVGSELNGDRIEKSQVVKECIKKLGIKNSELDFTYMVGDRKYDIIGAKENFVKSIGVEYGYAQGDELTQYGADYIVKDVSSLMQLLSSLINA